MSHTNLNNNDQHNDLEFPQNNNNNHNNNNNDMMITTNNDDVDDNDHPNNNNNNNNSNNNNNDEEEDSTEIAHFVDATIQDISNDDILSLSTTTHCNNHNNDDDDILVYHDSIIDNDNVIINHNTSFRSNISFGSQSNTKNNNSNNNSNSSHNNLHVTTVSTDNYLNELFESNINDDENNNNNIHIDNNNNETTTYYEFRKNALQQELEEEKIRSKMNLQRLIRGSFDHDDEYDNNGHDNNDGNDVVDDDDNNKGKLKIDIMKNGMDSVKFDYYGYDDDKNNIIINNGEKETEAVDEEDHNDNSNNNDDDDDDNYEHHDEFNNIVNSTKEEEEEEIPTTFESKSEKVTMLRQTYQAFSSNNTLSKDKGGDKGNKGNNNNDEDYWQYDGPKSNLYKLFKDGFDYIQKCKEEQQEFEMIHSSLSISGSPSPRRRGSPRQSPKKLISKVTFDFAPSSHQYPIIHFIDPTSKGEMSPQQPKEQQQTSPPSSTTFKAWNRSKSVAPYHKLNLFTKINTILQSRYDSSLKSVRFRNQRTDRMEFIPNVPFQSELASQYVSDPTDWHRAPLCHVYIAACASIDHYRAKVRPFIRAFVSQVDGAGSGNKDVASTAAKQATKKELYHKDKSKDNLRAMMKEQVAAASLAAAQAKDAAGSNASSKYMIIYVPVPQSCIETIINQVDDGNKSGGIGFRMRFGVQASKRGLSDGSNELSFDDEKTITNHDHQLNPSIIRQIPKEQKELFNKICNDFPNASTCILSSLLGPDNELASETNIQNQEFNDILETLSKIVVSGFSDRIQNYNDEIKKFQENGDKGDFDSRRYFLIKESLAFTYEQLQLHRESLNEYAELEAKLPLHIFHDEDKETNQLNLLLQAALSGDSEVFRNMVRSIQGINDISYFFLTYLFTRQARLMFLLKDPLRLVRQFTEYMKKVYFFRCGNCQTIPKNIRSFFLARIEGSLLASCWDLMSTVQSNLSFSLNSDDDSITLDDVESDIVCALLDLMNFARLRTYKFGDFLYTKDNNVCKAYNCHRRDTVIIWRSLSDLSEDVMTYDKSYETIEENKEIIDDLKADAQLLSPWSRLSLSSSYDYENIYLRILDIIIRLNTSLGRFRCAAMVSAEQAECYMIRKEFDMATQKLLPTVGVSLEESWDAVLSWRLFRLLCCQRISASPPEYLKSLLSCFGPRTTAALPSKLLYNMTNDLEIVIKSPEVIGHTWEISPFLGIDVNFQSTKGGEIIEASNILQKNIFNNVCNVGDVVSTYLEVFSRLPREILVDQMKVTLITYDDYLQRHEGLISESIDNTIVLDVDSPTIVPGKNKFKLPWTMMTVGQYALASVDIKWNNAFFKQDYCIPRYPVLCYDVLPTVSTQSIELDPVFLIPGHIQNVRLHFCAGADVVRDGEVEVLCSQGLKILPPGTEVKDGKWTSSCTFKLKPCKPGEKNTITVTVKSDTIEKSSVCASKQDHRTVETQTLEVIVSTSYHHKLCAQVLEMGVMAECPPMTARLQANIATLERPALTVSESNAFLYADCLSVLNATVNCNTPIPFSIKEWSISLPSYLVLEDDGDLNVGLFERAIMEGDVVFFGFKCRVDASSIRDETKIEQPLLNITLQDNFGEPVLHVLPLNIDSFYQAIIANRNRNGSNSLSVIFSLASEEGSIGSPVNIKCDIDCRHLTIVEQSSLLYNLSYDNSDWIIGGKVRGYMNSSAINENGLYTLMFVGIPVGSGVLKRFPRIELTDSVTKATLNVLSTYPKSFKSLTNKSIETFANLMMEEV